MFLRSPHILFFAAIVALTASAAGCQRPGAKPALPGNPAPSFTLKDLDGSAVRLTDHAGKVVVIDFWATWCGPCKKASRELEELHRKYRERGVLVIGISVDTGGDAVAKVKEFAAAQGLSYLLLLDDGSVKKAYGVTRIPSSFVLDRDHIIRDLYPGFRPGLGSDISRTIEKLL